MSNSKRMSNSITFRLTEICHLLFYNIKGNVKQHHIQVQTYTNQHKAQPTRYKQTQTCTRLGPNRYKYTQTCTRLGPPAKIHVRHSNASCVYEGWVCGQKSKMCKNKTKNTTSVTSRQENDSALQEVAQCSKKT